MGEDHPAVAHLQHAESADTALAAGLRDRRAEACSALYDRFASGLHRFAVLRLGGDALTAEDIVVETMVSAVRDIGRFDPRRASLAAWLYGIARRRVQMEIRSQRRHKSVPAEAQADLDAARGVSDGSDLATSASARLDAQRKAAALRDVLSDLEMEVLLLSCAEEMSAGEIGQAIGRSERAVHSILHRARQKARGRLVGDE